MRINIKVIPRSKKAKVKETDQGLKVYVSAPAIEGKANEALIKILARHFQVKKRQIEIIRGERSREKTIEIK